MSINPSSGEVRQLLRIVAPPVLALGALLVVGEVSPLDAWTTTLETSRRVATVLAGLWLVIAAGMAVHRTRRDAHAHKRLQELRDAAQTPGRALVHIEAVAWRSRAGQHAVVLNVATGYRYHLWLPETDLPIGAFALLEQGGCGVAVLDSIDARTVAAGHRHESRSAQQTAEAPSLDVLSPESQERDTVAILIRETEEFLRLLDQD